MRWTWPGLSVPWWPCSILPRVLPMVVRQVLPRLQRAFAEGRIRPTARLQVSRLGGPGGPARRRSASRRSAARRRPAGGAIPSRRAAHGSAGRPAAPRRGGRPGVRRDMRGGCVRNSPRTRAAGGGRSCSGGRCRTTPARPGTLGNGPCSGERIVRIGGHLSRLPGRRRGPRPPPRPGGCRPPTDAPTAERRSVSRAFSSAASSEFARAGLARPSRSGRGPIGSPAAARRSGRPDPERRARP